MLVPASIERDRSDDVDGLILFAVRFKDSRAVALYSLNMGVLTYYGPRTRRTKPPADYPVSFRRSSVNEIVKTK